MTDTAGRRLGSRRVKKALTISLIAGGLGAPWILFCQPWQFLTVFVSNHLHATSTQLGFFVAALNLSGIFHLVAVFLYSRSDKIKPPWLMTQILSRSSAFFIAGAALYVYRGEIGRPHWFW